MNKILVKLILQDGTKYNGYHFGYYKSVSGEVVFNTAMTGYTESLTDPSYKGQILVFTYPIIGNYGIPSCNKLKSINKFYESEKIHLKALVVSDYSRNPSHWNMSYKLSYWLKKNNIPGIYGIDTRSITKKLREKGTMLGKIFYNKDIPFYDTNKDNLISKVSISKKIIYGNGIYRILLIDCGVKNNILRCLLNRNCLIIRVPWNYNFIHEKYDGIFISNGPGNPENYKIIINNLKYAISKEIPIFGICLGNQLLGLSAGLKIYKLKYGHRSHNQPVILNNSNKTYITSQNHGYALSEEKIPNEWGVLFRNLNDKSCEGLYHKYKPFFSVQFHPEASGGPEDTEFLFDWFIENIKKYKIKNMY